MNRVRELLVGLSLLKTPIRRSGRWIDDRGGNSLFLEKFSLIRLWKFPVPLRREFGCKLLNLRLDQTRK